MGRKRQARQLAVEITEPDGFERYGVHCVRGSIFLDGEENFVEIVDIRICCRTNLELHSVCVLISIFT